MLPTEYPIRLALQPQLYTKVTINENFKTYLYFLVFTDFRLFPGKPQGRVEVRCGLNQEWGTISSKGTENTEIVATLVCRKLGYGNGSPLQPSDELGGYGPVWNVDCDEQHKYIENCTFTQTDEETDDYGPTYPYWDHSNDLHVKCGKGYCFT